MRCWSRFAAGCVTLAMLAIPRFTAADPIQITGGALRFEFSSGVLDLVGERGFTLGGNVAALSGTFTPDSTCKPCLPGATTVDIGGGWIDLGITGVNMTIDGQAYSGRLTSAPDGLVASVAFFGAVPLPPPPVPSASDPATATIVVPFEFSGSVTYDPIPFDGVPDLVIDELAGRGAATVLLVADPGLRLWNFRGALYQFESTDPVPEPSTLLLLTSGLTAAALRRRRRASDAAPSQQPPSWS